MDGSRQMEGGDGYKGREERLKHWVRVKSKGQGRVRMRSKLTGRDLEIVTWLGRHRVATAEQVMRRFGLQRSKAYQRLGAMVEHGLVIHEQGVRTARVYIATPKGLAATGLDLPRGGVSPATAAHDLAVVDAAIPLEGSVVRVLLTEREIRRAARLGSTHFRIAARGGAHAPDEGGMWPDLVVVDRLSGELHAVEVELTLKKRDRIADKLRAYSDSTYRTVTYQCATAGIFRAVSQAGARTSIGPRLRIEHIGDIDAPAGVECAELERLLGAVRQERERAHEQSRRADEATRQLDKERRTGMAMLHDIDRFLNADRAGQRMTRERWTAIVARLR